MNSQFEMPSCSVVGCKNRGQGGIRLFVFPRNAERRTLWAMKMKQNCWLPTNNSRLCEVRLSSVCLHHHHRRRHQGKVPTQRRQLEVKNRKNSLFLTSLIRRVWPTVSAQCRMTSLVCRDGRHLCQRVYKQPHAARDVTGWWNRNLGHV